jgi:Cdc6-like AAA superfamily ATPase
LSKLFAFPLLSNFERTIKLIAISNTLDLTVRAGLVLPNGAQPTVLPFKAYNSLDMAKIISTRLDASTEGQIEPVRIDMKAVELLTRKVEAQNGDLRTCLASLSSAVNLAETEWVKKTFTSELDVGACDIPLIKVSLSHVIKAFSSHTQQLRAAAGSVSSNAATSPTTRKIRSVPLQGKMVLISILIYMSRVRAGMPGVPTASTSAGSSPASTPNKHGDLTTSTLYAAYSAILSHDGSPFPPAAESDYRDLLSNLETLGLVSLHGSFAFGMGMARSSSAASRAKSGSSSGPRVELCVRDEEVRAGLGVGSEMKDKGSADEEVGKVWMREEAKVGKQRERLARAVEALKAVAEQD